MVEFCPKCGSILVPERRRNKVYLTCKRCSYSREAKKTDAYRVVERIPEEKRSKVAVIEGGGRRESERVEEERELVREEYYEVFLETMMEEAEE